MYSARSIGPLCLALAICPFGGCSTTTVARSVQTAATPLGSALDRLPVYRLSTADTSGSGVHLGGNLLLTSRHVLTAPRLFVHDVGGRPSTLTRYEVVAEGEGEVDHRADWALIEPLDVALDPCPSDLDMVAVAALHTGTMLHLVGFPAAGRQTWSELLGTPKQIVAMRVAALPIFTEIPVDPPIYMDAPGRRSFGGLSGGPAVYRDPASGRLTLVGIYKGEASVSFLGLEISSLHVLVPLPEQVVRIVHGRTALAVRN